MPDDGLLADVESDAERVVAQWDRLTAPFEAIHVKCFARREADAIKAAVLRRRPDAKLVMSWLEFSGA